MPINEYKKLYHKTDGDTANAMPTKWENSVWRLNTDKGELSSKPTRKTSIC